MSWDASRVNGMLDNVLVTVGIVVLVVRQFVWRSAEPSRMVKTPLVVVGVGLVYLVVELRNGFDWVPADWVFVGELALVAVTGTAMGYVTHFRDGGLGLQYRLTRSGVALWAVFVAVRVGSLAMAGTLGADLGNATGLVLLSFGVNRLAAVLVVRRRAEALLAGRSPSQAGAYENPAQPAREQHHR